MRALTEIAPFAQRPDDAALRRSREHLRFSPASRDCPATARLVEAFRSPGGGGDAVVATFDVEQVDDVGHWFLSRNRFVEFRFTECLLRSPALALALPPLRPDDEAGRTQRFHPVDSFFEASPLGLTSGVAWRLGFGPSRSCPALRGADAPEALAAGFVAEVLGGRYADFRVDRCAVGWSTWFRHACWDDSWMVTDKRHARVTLLCSTDAG